MTKRTLLWAALIALALLAVACGLTEEQTTAVEHTLRQMHGDGLLTAKELDGALDALANRSGINWEVAGLFIANLIAALVGAPYLVKKMRGPATQKQGLPASQVEALTQEIVAQVRGNPSTTTTNRNPLPSE